MIGIRLLDSGKAKIDVGETWVMVCQDQRPSEELSDVPRLKLTARSPAVLFWVPNDGHWFVMPLDSTLVVSEDLEIQFIDKQFATNEL